MILVSNIEEVAGDIVTPSFNLNLLSEQGRLWTWFEQGKLVNQAIIANLVKLQLKPVSLLIGASALARPGMWVSSVMQVKGFCLP